MHVVKRTGLKVVFLFCLSSSVQAQSSPTDFFTNEYFANWGLKYTNAADAYALGFTGAGVKIGIADTAAQLSHPEFSGRVYWPSIEPPFPNPGYLNFPEHGTHVMGAAAAARNGVGMMGVAFDAQIANVVAVGESGYPQSSDWAQELINAGVSVMNGSFGPRAAPEYKSPNYQVVDFQFYYGNDVLDYVDSVQKLNDADVVMVFSAGNNRIAQPNASVLPAGYGSVPLFTPTNTALGYTNNPSDAIYRIYTADADSQDPNTWTGNQVPLNEVQNYDLSGLAGTLISVVAVDINEQTNTVNLASFSNQCGIAADWCIAAPGVVIYSSVPMNAYGTLSGTSQAAPLVAGSAAVLRQAFPYMAARHIIEVLLTNATPIDPLNPTSVTNYGHGLVNIGKAVKGPAEFGSPSLIAGNSSIFAPIFAVDTQGYNSVWSNNIQGTGGFSKAGEGILILTGNNTYTGDTTITGGVLRVDGSIATSDLTVSSQATLQGIGTVGNTEVSGTLAAGNSVGTLTVQGNLSLLDGARYQFEIDENQNSDLVVVSGTASIDNGAVFDLVAADGVYLNQIYPLFDAGMLSGTFQNLHTQYTFIDLNFQTVGNDLGMIVERNNVPMAAYAQTNNQRAVAQAIDAQSSGDEPYNDVLLNSNSNQLPGWYQDWSGEIYSANQAALLYNGRVLSQMINWRLEDSWLERGYTTRLQQVGQSNADTTVWAQAYGDWDNFSANADAQQATANSNGFVMGLDHAVSQRLRIGGGFSASTTDTTVAASRANTSGYHLMLYGTYDADIIRLNGGAVQSWYSANVSRTLPLDDLGNASSTVASQSTQLFGEISAPLKLAHAENQQTSLSPFAQVSQTWLNTANFGESGAEAALSGQATGASVGFGTLGARVNHQWQTDKTLWQASLSAGWQHAWGDLSPTTTLAFATGANYTVSAAAIATNAAVIEVGIGANFGPSSRLNVVYSTTLAGQSSSQMLQAQMNWTF
jgi:subtilase-type serine protease